jgi:hypothetical protein
MPDFINENEYSQSFRAKGRTRHKTLKLKMTEYDRSRTTLA